MSGRWAVLAVATTTLAWGCGSEGAAPAAPTAADGDVGGSGDGAAQPELPGESDVAPDTIVDQGPAEPGLEDNFGVEETEGDPACEALDPAHCLTPFPSDHFRAEGRLRLDGALPLDDYGEPMRADVFAEHDGFSPATPIVFELGGVAAEPLIAGAATPDDIARSLDPDSPTVLVRASDGARVPHWAEVDHFTLAEGTPMVVLRPVVRLDFATRYVVGVRGLKAGDGTLLQASPAMAALRDAQASSVRGVHARRAHFEAAVFPVLESAGVARGELQLAFDFTTASEASITDPLLRARDVLLEQIGDQGPSFEVVEIVPIDDEWTAYRVDAVAQVPSFLSDPAALPRTFTFDAEGTPLSQGFEAVPFEIHVPHSALAALGSAAVLQYGHGLFWSREEGRKDWLRQLAAREGMLLLAADMQGMSEGDIADFGTVILEDFGAFPKLADEVLQGILNHVALQRLAKGALPAATEEALRAEGTPLADGRVFYYGNSQGGTLGSILAAVSVDVERAVLGVPGCSYGMLLNRSNGFTNFVAVLRVRYPEVRDLVTLLALAQSGLDRIEALNYVHRVHGDPFPGTPPHRVLLQIAKEDAVVDNKVSFLLARTAGARLLEPAVRPIWGVEPLGEDSDAGNGVAEFDFGWPDNPDPTKPGPEAHDTHEDLRRLRAGQDQLTHFLQTGQIQSFCDGVCDPD